MDIKRILSFCLICSALVGLSGCSEKESSSSQNEVSSSVSKPQVETLPNVQDDPSSVVDALTPDFSQLDTQKRGWGQGVQFDEQNRPTSCVQFQQKYGKYDAQFIKEDAGKTIYLTFDEGYENGYTTQILDVLKEKNVPAVFFVTYDYVEKNPDLIRRMIDEGHTVGNHTCNHPSMPTISVEKQREEIETLHNCVKEQFGYTMTLFRPPKGEFSEQSLAVTQSLGYQTIFWSFAYADWDAEKQPDPADALKKTVERVHDGAIYLLHAVSKTNTEILGQWIDRVNQQGYCFGSLA